jgi:hypothetical protein
MKFAKLAFIFLFILSMDNCERNYSPLKPTSEFITIGNVTYGRYDYYWYFMSNGHKTDRAILDRVIVKVIPGIDIYSFSFSEYNIPNLNISYLDINYYVINIPPNQNPFKIAQYLWNTGIFDNLEFSALVTFY